MNTIGLGIVWFIVGYAAGIGTIVILAQRIKKQFGEEGAQGIVKK